MLKKCSLLQNATQGSYVALGPLVFCLFKNVDPCPFAFPRVNIFPFKLGFMESDDVDLSDNVADLSYLYVGLSDIMSTCQIILLLSVWH